MFCDGIRDCFGISKYCLRPTASSSSSFYGEVHFNDGPSRIGHTIGAWVPGNSSAVASTTVIELSGNLVYSINIPGDITETAGVKEGGVEGDEITFIMDSRVIAKGTWHMGTNASLNIHPPLPLLGSSVGGKVGIPIDLFWISQ